MSADKNKKSKPASSVESETKRKFREALEAKQARQGEDHIDGTGPQVQPHGQIEAKRTFRRKTG
jgi:hypothetical protein